MISRNVEQGRFEDIGRPACRAGGWPESQLRLMKTSSNDVGVQCECQAPGTLCMDGAPAG